jgi:hypothetical protein
MAFSGTNILDVSTSVHSLHNARYDLIQKWTRKQLRNLMFAYKNWLYQDKYALLAARLVNSHAYSSLQLEGNSLF